MPPVRPCPRPSSYSPPSSPPRGGFHGGAAPSSKAQAKGKAPWFPSVGAPTSASYQSGAPVSALDPLAFGSSAGGQPGGSASVSLEAQQQGVDAYETRFGWRLDILGALTYLLGPLFGASWSKPFSCPVNVR
jgi:hypothetical protein